MEKSQYNLCLKILERLANAKILDSIILIGSWCLVFYKEYLHDDLHFSAVHTRDIDFLIPQPQKLATKVDIPELIKDIGFVIELVPAIEWEGQAITKLVHEELIIEFLVPQKGSQDKLHKISQLGMTAQGLHFFDLLIARTISMRIKNFTITMPHPANFLVHKLFIATRRSQDMLYKKVKDVEQARQLLAVLKAKNDLVSIRQVSQNLSTQMKNAIKKMLIQESWNDLLYVLDL